MSLLLNNKWSYNLHDNHLTLQVSDKLVESFDKKSLENVAAFIGFYHTQGQKLSDELFEDTNELNGLELKLKQIDERLAELESLWGSSSHAYYEKYVKILV